MLFLKTDPIGEINSFEDLIKFGVISESQLGSKVIENSLNLIFLNEKASPKSKDKIEAIQKDDKVKENISIYKQKKKDVDQKLKESNIDIKDVYKSINKKATKITDKMKKEAKWDQNSIESFSKEVYNALLEIIDEFKLRDLPLNILLYLCIAFINIFSEIMLTILFGGNAVLAGIVVSVFVAPIVEEFGKNISIRLGISGSFFVTFNTMEFGEYIIKYGLSPKMIVARLIVVCFHLFTTLLQKVGYKHELDEKNDSWIFYITAIFSHGIWNAGLAGKLEAIIFGR